MKQHHSYKFYRNLLCLFATLAIFISFGFSKPVRADNLPIVYVSGSLSSDRTWSSGYVYMISSTVTVSSGMTLTIEPGAIVKVNSYSAGLQVNAGGTLSANGTATNPIIFTSYQDDTVGGDSNNNGSSIGSVGDYDTAINVMGGTASVAHAVLRNGSVSVTNNYSGSTLALTDSEVDNPFYLTNAQTSNTTIQRNHFAMQNVSYPITLSSSDASVMQLTGTNKNTFSGSGKQVVIALNNDNIPSSEVWDVDSTSGLKGLYIQSPLMVNGVLTVEQGSIIKIVQGATGLQINSGGTLNISGVAANPVVFTSYRDDAEGGDTNGDGSSSGATGDYDTAITGTSGASLQLSFIRVTFAGLGVGMSGNANIDHVVIDHVLRGFYITGSGLVGIMNSSISNASYGLNVYDQARVTFRGSFDTIANKAIMACNWASQYQACNVDASYTDWGTANGPYLSSNTLACGQVETLPWVHDATTYNGANAFIPNCDNSLTPDQNLDASVTHFGQRVSARQIDCNNGFQDACDAIHNAFACLGSAVNLAGSTSPIPLPQIHEDGSIDSWKSTVEGEATDYMRNSAVEIVLPSQLGQMFGKVMSLVGMFNSLSSAYNSCAP
ncbi:MAG TPA: hypothetical protein VJR27_04485 [Candidatus Saccharimonadales bacterium]|nr:hypothetical protein [Candidatus Saccharimonadales bacterium]